MNSSLYRHFDKNGHLLYVGVSLSALNRLRQHRDCSGWYEQICRVEIQPFPDRISALEAERTAILKEGPLYNINGKKPPPPSKHEIEESRKNLISRTVNFRPVYKIPEAADVLCLGETAVRKLMAEGKIGYLDLPWRGDKTKRFISGWQIIDYIESVMGNE